MSWCTTPVYQPLTYTNRVIWFDRSIIDDHLNGFSPLCPPYPNETDLPWRFTNLSHKHTKSSAWIEALSMTNTFCLPPALRSWCTTPVYQPLTYTNRVIWFDRSIIDDHLNGFSPLCISWCFFWDFETRSQSRRMSSAHETFQFHHIQMKPICHDGLPTSHINTPSRLLG